MPPPDPYPPPPPALANEAELAIASTLAALLAARPTGSVCPSEVARALCPATPAEPRGAERWRRLMPAIHRVVAAACAAGTLTTSWQGAPRVPDAGPYRIHPVSKEN